MIKIITEADFFPDMDKNIHYVSWTPYMPPSITGYGSLSSVYGVCMSAFSHGFSESKLCELFQRIDYGNETGTLYPVANITIMPSYRASYSDVEIDCQFNDVIEAQNQYIHARTMIVDKRVYHYVNPVTHEIDDETCLRNIDRYFSELSTPNGEKIDVYVVLHHLEKISSKVAYRFATMKEVNELRRKPEKPGK